LEGSVASGYYRDVEHASKEMAVNGMIVRPRKDMQRYFDNKFAKFEQLRDFMLKFVWFLNILLFFGEFQMKNWVQQHIALVSREIFA